MLVIKQNYMQNSMSVTKSIWVEFFPRQSDIFQLKWINLKFHEICENLMMANQDESSYL